MANDKIDTLEGHILMGYAKQPDFESDLTAQSHFEERFIMTSFREQYEIMAWMFSHLTNMESQPWLLNLANQMVKQKSPSYQNSQFQTKDTMVEFFIKQYSYGEVEELRNTLWALIK